ncbi:hypothetical protein DVB69_01385 [Sporosarcina sp. BI001-red]|uniref:hypothetical protein n=1 Tax=Sporosarcina sp. BI001-red TaxID=2282866 RepID=UPI000E24B767|nr:hypothetical protein [Sporosarcina sp. BI001-red]REB11019.1 hypothetical protein DVB69_01385 [Sporosarcina sp. BI001-red]
MLKVKVKQKGKIEFTVPLPYLLLNVGGWIATSPLLWKFVNSTFIQKNIDKNAKSFIPISIERQDVRHILREIKRYRGLTIVEVKDKDGTEVVVKL